MDEIQRELGRLAEAVENGKDDRSELKRLVEKVGDAVGDLQRSVNGLAQTVTSMTNQMVSLNNEKCGQRLDTLESKMRHYDRIFGTANSFVWKAFGYLIVAAVLGAGALRAVMAFWPR